MIVGTVFLILELNSDGLKTNTARQKNVTYASCSKLQALGTNFFSLVIGETKMLMM